MRTRTSGILCDSSGERTVNKQFKGERIFARLGNVSQDEAETWLRTKQTELECRRENAVRDGAEQLFATAAAKYLIECRQREVRTLEVIAYHVTILLPYIGGLTLRDVCRCRVPDDYLLQTKRPLLMSPEVLAAVLAGWTDRELEC